MKLLQNMVSNTTQHPPLSHTLSVYTVHLLWDGGRGRGGGQREGRGATVHKYSSYVHGGSLVGYSQAVISMLPSDVWEMRAGKQVQPSDVWELPVGRRVQPSNCADTAI